MPAELLLDTGAFVALVDRSATRHTDCVAALERWHGPVVTTEAVLTETLNLVGPGWKPQKICLEFFLRGAFMLLPSSESILRRAAALMEKYEDVPMDFADATFIAQAEERQAEHIFTLDRRGFSTYRLHGRKPFAILP